MKVEKMSNEEYNALQGSMKYYKYYTGNIRLYTKKSVLEALRLGLKIKKFDIIMKTTEELTTNK